MTLSEAKLSAGRYKTIFCSFVIHIILESLNVSSFHQLIKQLNFEKYRAADSFYTSENYIDLTQAKDFGFLLFSKEFLTALGG